MTHPVMDGTQLYKLFTNGYLNLKRNMAMVDELNVFPVPDGDTGKNMTATIEGGVIGSNANEASVQALMKEFSHSALLSARGNSGVILSQFIRGIAKGTKGKDTLTVLDFIDAIKSGVNHAYNSVVKPVEGTMLTVMREGSESAYRKHPNLKDFDSCLDAILAGMRKSLKNTPELLPVLKEAGVVDSGGAGLICIFEGMLMALRNEEIPDEPVVATTNNTSLSYDPENLLTYGYCTEFILQLQASKTDIDAFNVCDMISFLETIGESIVAVQDETLVKVHVHTFEPENVIAYARKFGELVTIKIENMTVQHSEQDSSAHPSDAVSNLTSENSINSRFSDAGLSSVVDYGQIPAERTKYAVVATASGSGIINYFKDAGVAAIVDGGQTNNPSAEDFVNAFKQLNAEYIIVLPNDSNIVMTAMQAAKIYKDADIRVIKTKSIAEGYSALSMMDLSLETVEDVISEMTYYLPNVTTGYVTTATRDAYIDGVEITKDHYIGLTTDTIISDSPDKVTAALMLLDNLPDIDDKQVVTAFCGLDVTEEEKDNFSNEVHRKYPLIEIGMIDGKQDVYSFIFAIE